MIKKILLLITMLTCPIFAAAVDNMDVIWVWGDGELLAKMISTMYVILNEPTFIGPVGKICACIAFFSIGGAMLKRAETGDKHVLVFGFYLLLTIFVWKGFLEVEQRPSNRVYLLNMNEAAGGAWATCTPVNGDNNCYLPWATKYIMTTATNFERGFVALIELASVTTNAQTYSYKNMGYGYGFDIYQAADRQLPPSWATRTYNAFWDNCVIYEINNGSKTLDQIIRSKDLSTDILTPDSARLTTIYTKDKPKGYLSSCSDVGLNHLTGDETCQTIVSNTPGSKNKDADETCVGYQNFAQLMLNTVKDADSVIKQQIMTKMTNRAIRSSMIVAGLDPNAMAGGLVTADREQRTKWASMGLMAKEWLPTIRDIMQSFAPIFALFGAFGAILVGGIKPIGMFVGFVATLIVWSVCLEFINIATYHYLSLSIPNMFGFDIGKDEIRTTMLTSNYINDEFQKAASFMGYMAIAAYAIAQGIVSMASGKIGASFAGSVSGLGLSSFAVRSAAQGKIETPMSSVGPDGVINWNKFGDIQEKINSYGGETRTSRRDGFERETTYSGGDGATKFTSELGSDVSISKDGKVGDVNINSGTKANLDTSIDRTLAYNHNKAARETEQRQEQLVNSMSNTISQLDQAGYVHAKSGGLEYQKMNNGNWMATGSDGKSWVFGDGTTIQTSTTNSNSATDQITIGGGSNVKTGGTATAKGGGKGAGALNYLGSIGSSASEDTTNANSSTLNKTTSTNTTISRGDNASFGGGFAKGRSYSEQNSSTNSSQLAANFQDTTSQMDSYTKAQLKEEAFQKAMNMSKNDKLALSENLYTSMLQKAYDDGNKPENGPNGGERGALRALLALEGDRNGEYIREYMQNTDLYKQVQDFMNKMGDKIDNTDINKDGLKGVDGSDNQEMINSKTNENNIAINSDLANIVENKIEESKNLTNAGLVNKGKEIVNKDNPLPNPTSKSSLSDK